MTTATKPLNKATLTTLAKIESAAARSANGWVDAYQFDLLHVARLQRHKLIIANPMNQSLVRPA